MENKTHKAIKSKKPFNGYANMVKLIPESYKVEGNIFGMKDGVEDYLLEWKKGKAKVLKASDSVLKEDGFERLKSLMNYKSEPTIGNLTEKERIAENTLFQKTLSDLKEKTLGETK